MKNNTNYTNNDYMINDLTILVELFVIVSADYVIQGYGDNFVGKSNKKLSGVYKTFVKSFIKLGTFDDFLSSFQCSNKEIVLKKYYDILIKIKSNLSTTLIPLLTNIESNELINYGENNSNLWPKFYEVRSYIINEPNNLFSEKRFKKLRMQNSNLLRILSIIEANKQSGIRAADYQNIGMFSFIFHTLLS